MINRRRFLQTGAAAAAVLAWPRRAYPFAQSPTGVKKFLAKPHSWQLYVWWCGGGGPPRTIAVQPRCRLPPWRALARAMGFGPSSCAFLRHDGPCLNRCVFLLASAENASDRD
jgi:hypothetical protein